MPNETAVPTPGARRRRVPPSTVSGGQQPAWQPPAATPPAPGSGADLYRRYMPGAAGPSPAGAKPAGGSATGTLTPPNLIQGATQQQPWDNKGGGTGPYMPDSPPNPAGTPPPAPAVPTPGAAAGRQNLSNVTQQNGQLGMMGRGGRFQQLGQHALNRYQQQQPPPAPAVPTPSTPPPTGGGSGPTMQPDQPYVTDAQMASDPSFAWFVNGERAAGRPTDAAAFNRWFRQNGQQFDPAGWARLYGGAPTTGTPPPPPGETMLP